MFKSIFVTTILALSTFGIYAQNMTKLEASKLLHESIVLNGEWTEEDGLDLCNKEKFLKGIRNGGDLNSQSNIFHHKKIHQNVLNRAIAYGCYDIAHLILDEYLPETENEIYILVNDPDRVLNISPIKRTINRDNLNLFKKLYMNFSISDDISTLFRKIAKKDRAHMADILLKSPMIHSLDEIYRSALIAVNKDHVDTLEVILNHSSDIQKLSSKKLIKLKSIDSSESIKELLSNY